MAVRVVAPSNSLGKSPQARVEDNFVLSMTVESF